MFPYPWNWSNLREVEDHLDQKENNKKTKYELYEADHIALLLFAAGVAISLIMVYT